MFFRHLHRAQKRTGSDMLVGESVAQRPWFREGLNGPVAIDVHEAQLLADLLGQSDEPFRFIDFAAPAQNEDGDVRGVLGAHLDWQWVLDNLRGLSAPGIDVILISREGVVLHGPVDLVGEELTVGAAQAETRTQEGYFEETWPDGNRYVSIVVPTIRHQDLPSFGWSLLVRQDVQNALEATMQLVRSFWLTLGAGALVALLLLYLGARWVATPLTRIVSFTRDLGDGSADKPPHPETRYEEASALSTALVRAQSRLMSAAR